MKVITIMNYKGGVGKTATAVNLSYNLSERGYKTLLIDLVNRHQYPIFKSLIRDCASVNYSTYRRMPLRKCRSTKNACLDYNDFTAELIQEVQ